MGRAHAWTPVSEMTCVSHTMCANEIRDDILLSRVCSLGGFLAGLKPVGAEDSSIL